MFGSSRSGLSGSDPFLVDGLLKEIKAETVRNKFREEKK